MMKEAVFCETQTDKTVQFMSVCACVFVRVSVCVCKRQSKKEREREPACYTSALAGENEKMCACA